METKIRILLADSNSDFSSVLTDLIRAEADLELVAQANDGLEALTLTAELMPDVLILDLVLPKLDGIEVLRRIPETGAHCKVLVLSGFYNHQVVMDCSAAGATTSCPSPATSPPFSPA